jgi:hypothetical protein
MVVEGGQPAAEGGDREGDAVGEEEQSGQKLTQELISAAGRPRAHGPADVPHSSEGQIHQVCLARYRAAARE